MKKRTVQLAAGIMEGIKLIGSVARGLIKVVFRV